jgi:hypothetical protein
MSFLAALLAGLTAPLAGVVLPGSTFCTVLTNEAKNPVLFEVAGVELILIL